MITNLGIAIGLTVCLTTQSAMACRCAPPPLEDAAEAAALIVEAAVTELIELPEDSFGVTSTAVVLEVSAAWKTEAPRRIIVIDTDPCRFGYDKNVSYLLYLQPMDFGLYGTSRCEGSTKRDDAGTAIKWLNTHEASMPIILRSRGTE